MTSRWYHSEVNLPASYKHNNGDLEPVMILDYDGKGNAWVRWAKDDFVNLMPCERLVTEELK